MIKQTNKNLLINDVYDLIKTNTKIHQKYQDSKAKAMRRTAQ